VEVEMIIKETRQWEAREAREAREAQEAHLARAGLEAHLRLLLQQSRLQQRRR